MEQSKNNKDIFTFHLDVFVLESKLLNSIVRVIGVPKIAERNRSCIKSRDNFLSMFTSRGPSSDAASTPSLPFFLIKKDDFFLTIRILAQTSLIKLKIVEGKSTVSRTGLNKEKFKTNYTTKIPKVRNRMGLQYHTGCIGRVNQNVTQCYSLHQHQQNAKLGHRSNVAVNNLNDLSIKCMLTYNDSNKESVSICLLTA